MTTTGPADKPNMRTDDIVSELRIFIMTRFAVPERDRDFTNTVDLFNYGYIDSLGAADLASFIESRFGIKFSDTDWVSSPLSTIEEIAGFVSKRQLGEV
jgi:methoxymalonate biosynthesis acyl carrier protein